MLVDHEGNFWGIEIQEYDPTAKKLTGPVHFLTEGTALGCTEAPHLLEKNGFFYLILAEGGTEYDHAVSIARSKEILGPYDFTHKTQSLQPKMHLNSIFKNRAW